MTQETLIKTFILVCLTALAGIAEYKMTVGDNQAIDCVEVER